MNSRLFRKRILAEWVPVDVDSNDFLQLLTDAMAYNTSVQINYRGSGWRSILPYGWNSSKDGNILLMCYKDTGEIRSYRVDRIYDLLVNNDILTLDDEDNMSFQDFQIPQLPNLDEIVDETEKEIDEEMPFDDAMEALTTDEIPEEYQEEDLPYMEEDPTAQSLDEVIENDDNSNDLSTSAEEERTENVNENNNIDNSMDMTNTDINIDTGTNADNSFEDTTVEEVK